MEAALPDKRRSIANNAPTDIKNSQNPEYLKVFGIFLACFEYNYYLCPKLHLQ